jgi:hypothetical protein
MFVGGGMIMRCPRRLRHAPTTPLSTMRPVTHLTTLSYPRSQGGHITQFPMKLRIRGSANHDETRISGGASDT